MARVVVSRERRERRGREKNIVRIGGVVDAVVVMDGNVCGWKVWLWRCKFRLDVFAKDFEGNINSTILLGLFERCSTQLMDKLAVGNGSYKFLATQFLQSLSAGYRRRLSCPPA